MSHDHHAETSLTLPPKEELSPFLAKLGRHLTHELNNPISAIASSAFLIQDILGSSNDPVTKEILPFVESIQEECETLKAILEEFAKYVSTDSVLKNRIDLSELIHARASDIARDQLPVVSELTNQKIFADADAASLGFVLRELAAFAQSEGATRVTFSVFDGPRATIVVRDNRPKHPSSEFLLVAFSPSFDKNSNRTGLGLKLPLARRMIELHGGTLEIPDQIGQETEIRILLPHSANGSA